MTRTPGLLILPAVTAAAAAFFPSLPATRAAMAIAFACGTLTALITLVATARDQLSGRASAALGVGCLGVVGAAALPSLAGQAPILALLFVNLGLVGVAHAAGGWIGRRIQHAGHLLPACAVAAAADLASVVHPSGPSHAIASSDRALSLLAVAFPIPGEPAVAPVLGVGDLVFVALVLGAAVTHALPLLRASLAVAAGIAIAGVLAALLQREVPALVPIGAAVVACMPQARAVRREDRRVTQIAIGAAAAVVVAVLLAPR